MEKKMKYMLSWLTKFWEVWECAHKYSFGL